MLRRFSLGLAVLVLAGASVQTPFAHFHPEDPEHHHAKGFAHAHLGLEKHPHESEGPEIEPHDDDELAVYLEWTPAAAPRISVAYAEAPVEPAVQFGRINLGSAPEFRPQAHSPPKARLLPARAPPL